jgi:hypothetical protein
MCHASRRMQSLSSFQKSVTENGILRHSKQWKMQQWKKKHWKWQKENLDRDIFTAAKTIDVMLHAGALMDSLTIANLNVDRSSVAMMGKLVLTKGTHPPKK